MQILGEKIEDKEKELKIKTIKKFWADKKELEMNKENGNLGESLNKTDREQDQKNSLEQRKTDYSVISNIEKRYV